MKALSNLVLVLIFAHAVRAVLIVPHWMHLGGIKPSRSTEQSRKRNEITTATTTTSTTSTSTTSIYSISSKVDEADKSGELTERENAENFNKEALDFFKSPNWKSLSKEERQFIKFVMILNVLEYKLDPPEIHIR